MGRYYSSEIFDKSKEQINFIYGRRYDGKSSYLLKKGVEKYWKNGEQFVIVNQCKNDFIEIRNKALFDVFVINGDITRITGGERTGVCYCSSRWFLCRYEDGERIVDDIPFAYAFNAEEENGSVVLEYRGAKFSLKL